MSKICTLPNAINKSDCYDDNDDDDSDDVYIWVYLMNKMATLNRAPVIPYLWWIALHNVEVVSTE